MSSPIATTINLFLGFLGASPPSTLEDSISICLLYNASLTMLHLASCFLTHTLLSLGLKLNLFTTTGPVRPLTIETIAYFTVVDYITNIIFSIFFTWVTLPSAVPWSFQMPGVLEMTIAIATLQILQDFWHYPTHRFLHVTNITWLREMHTHHHREVKATVAMNSFDLMNLHPLEYWLTIMPAYVLGFWLTYAVPLALGFAPNIFVSHIAVLFTFTIECLGHSNVDLPVPSVMLVIGYTSCSDHAVHHMDPRHNFAIFFTFLDRMFGTYKEFSSLEVAQKLQTRRQSSMLEGAQEPGLEQSRVAVRCSLT